TKATALKEAVWRSTELSFPKVIMVSDMQKSVNVLQQEISKLAWEVQGILLLDMRKDASRRGLDFKLQFVRKTCEANCSMAG
ncbi:unnamed protein product, partial [Ilex paraguariensis]